MEKILDRIRIKTYPAHLFLGVKHRMRKRERVKSRATRKKIKEIAVPLGPNSIPQ